jgi:NADH-quinone oxidoreductase subunit A
VAIISLRRLCVAPFLFSYLFDIWPGYFYVPLMQIEQYWPVLLLLLVAIGFCAFMLIGSVVVGRLANKRIRHPASKDIPYECGMNPVTGEGTRLSVKFYLVAMLFILFDIEVVFLYPWAVVYQQLLRDPVTRDLILVAIGSFLGILVVGYIYAVKKKAFDWKS